MKRCVIVGAGIVGQLCALELYDRGWRNITIVEDPDSPPASWAGGGILSPLFPWRYTQAMNALCRDSVSRYKDLIQRLFESGFATGDELNLSGMWMEVRDEESSALKAWISQYGGIKSEWRQRIISEEPRNGLWFPEIGSVRNPRLLKSLRLFLRAKGVVFRSGKVTACVGEKDNTVALNFLGEGKIRFDNAILAPGAGISRMVDFAEMFFPAKGEMLLYRLGKAAPSEIVLAHEGYCIPRENGDTLVGSTLRIGDGTCYPTVSGRFELEKIAEKVLPQALGTRPAFHWAGVRPGFVRDWPIISALPSHGSVFLAAGHYRNGLASAPATAELLAQLACNEAPFLDPSIYSFPSSRSSSSFLSR